MRVALNATPLLFPTSGIARALSGLLGALLQVEDGTLYTLLMISIQGNGRRLPSPMPARCTVRWWLLSRWLLYKMWSGGWRWPALSDLAGPVDIFHDMEFTIPPRRRSERLVLTIHDCIPAKFPDLVTPAVVTRFYTQVLAAARQADAVFADSDATRQDLAALGGIDPARVHTVPLGVDPQFCPPPPDLDRSALLRRTGLPHPYILYAGRISPVKNVLRLLKAYALAVEDRRIPHHLVLAGTADPGFGASVAEAVSALGLGGRVIHTNFLPDADLVRLYQGADLFLFPSLYEGFGLPPLEAMACGTPVLASTGGSLPEVLGKAAFLVDPLDTEGWAAALSRAVEDEALRAGLRSAGLAKAAEYSWDRAAQATLAVYRALAGPAR